jgi:ubiquinone/menaquinone biosynthesis C-methylase UbiE
MPDEAVLTAFALASSHPPPTAPTVFQYTDGWIEFIPTSAGYRVHLRPHEGGGFVALEQVDTWFPPEIVRGIAASHGFAWTAEVIARHQDPNYLERIIGRQLAAYFPPSARVGKRVLDFGCGTGASTLALARLLPGCEIIGVDFDAVRVALARRIAAISDVPNVTFLTSPSPLELPAGIGPIDGAMLSATLQHMLPEERRTLLPMIWKLLPAGGALMINQTSHRWFPLEADTSGLYLINYLPVRVAAFLARHFSSRDEEANRDRDLTGLLRAGLRGASESEVLNLLPANTIVAKPILERTRALYWEQGPHEPGLGLLRTAAAYLFAWTEKRWGIVPSKHLDMVIRKHG